MIGFVIENDVLEMSESIITRENIDKQLSHYATILTVLMALKEKYDEEDNKEFDSDYESIIYTPRTDDEDDDDDTDDEDSDE